LASAEFTQKNSSVTVLIVDFIKNLFCFNFPQVDYVADENGKSSFKLFINFCFFL